MVEIKLRSLPRIYYLIYLGLNLIVSWLIITADLNLGLKLLGLLVVQYYSYKCGQELGWNKTKTISSLRHNTGLSWVLTVQNEQIDAIVCKSSVITAWVLILVFVTATGKYRCWVSAAQYDAAVYRKLCVLLMVNN